MRLGGQEWQLSRCLLIESVSFSERRSGRRCGRGVMDERRKKEEEEEGQRWGRWGGLLEGAGHRLLLEEAGQQQEQQQPSLPSSCPCRL